MSSRPKLLSSQDVDEALMESLEERGRMLRSIRPFHVRVAESIHAAMLPVCGLAVLFAGCSDVFMGTLATWRKGSAYRKKIGRD